MPNAADISASMVATLALTEPELDTSIGSISRRIIDAAAASVAEAFLDQHLTNYQYDIDSMTAGTLEGFVRLFGMDRQQARYAVGTVTFSRSATMAAVSTATIPIGTQVLAQSNPAQYVQTAISTVMAIGQTTIDIPVQALTPGAVGNISAGLLTTLASSVDNVSTTTINVAALTGGQDAETDDDLRNRWKATVFRNLAGTEQMYRAMALAADPSVNTVNVLGARKTWLDKVTITNGTSGPLSFGNPQFIYSTGVFVGIDIGALNLFSQNVNYTVSINNTIPLGPATITINAVSGNLPDGNYDIQFDYVPTYSRNDPFGTRWSSNRPVNNRLDIWTNGVNITQVTQSCTFSSSANLRFSTTSGAALLNTNFTKLDGTHPANNDYFMPLAYGPIVYVPGTLVVGGTTYTQGVHYDIVHRSDAFGYAPTSLFGLVWYASGSVPTNTPAFPLTYQYNSVPSTIQQNIESQWRLLGTDVMAHAGIATQYRFHFAIIFQRGFDTSAVTTAIQTAVGALVGSLGFDSALQVSDVLQAVHNVPGVDNVRFLNSTDDATHYAIEPILPNGNPTTPLSQIGGRAADLYFDDAHYPVFNSVRIIPKTRTNFGSS